MANDAGGITQWKRNNYRSRLAAPWVSSILYSARGFRKIHDPEELRRTLFEVVQSHDRQKLDTICRVHRDIIGDR